MTTLFILMVLLVSCGKIGDPRPGKAARMEKEPPPSLSETTPAPVKAPPVPTEVPRATMDEAPPPAKVAPPPPKAPPPPVKLTRPPKKAPRASSKITVPLSLDQSECGVILMWDLNAYKTLPDLVRIYRSDVSGDGCEDCPGEGRVVAELDRAKLAYLREYDGSFVYIDRTVRQDFVYRYAIVVCTDRGGCSETSGEAEIEFTYTMDGCP
ncbi:MAG: hypothetical protein WCX84_05150 [Syntrophales bacterium]